MRSTRTSSSTRPGLLPRASSTTSPTSAVSSSSSARMSARSAARSCSGSRSESSRVWMLARRLAIGVRSSWLASATRWRWASTERSSASRVALKLRASRASSSSPGGRDPLAGIGVVGDLLGPAGEARDRGQRRARDERPEARGERDPGRRDDREDDEHVAQRVVDLGERARDLQCAATGSERTGEHAHVDAGDVRARQRLPGRLSARSPAPWRAPAARSWRPEDATPSRPRRRSGRSPRRRRSARRHDRSAPGRAGRRRDRARHPVAAVVVGQLARPRAQRVVDLRVQLRPDGDEDRGGGDQHGDGDGEPGDRGDAVAQRHGSRRT